MRVKRNSGKDYENHCARKMRLHGYMFVSVCGKSHDYGADIIARRWFRKIVVQCKDYAKPVGIKAVQEVIAARQYYGASIAAVATNRTFTRAAKQLAQKCGVELWERY